MAEVTADGLHDEDDVGIMVLPNFDSISIFFFSSWKENTHRDTEFLMWNWMRFLMVLKLEI